MSILTIHLISFLLAFLITTLLIPKILLISIKKKMLDIPCSRKVHTQTSSRLGGLAFFPSLFITICIVIPIFHSCGVKQWGIDTPWLLLSLGAGFLMTIVGASDDIMNGMSYKRKFTYQILASFLIIVSGAWVNNFHGIFGIYEVPMWIGFPLTSFLIVFIMNSINLIDGIDGLSSGLSIVALSFYGAIFFLNNQWTQAIVSFATAGALLGFFRYNFLGLKNRYTKIFMGDSGTLFTGAIISLLAIKLLHLEDAMVGNHKSNAEILIAYSVLIVPCFDVMRVVLHRLKSRKPLFLADRNHIHHKILALGFSTQHTLFIILSFSATITLINILVNQFFIFEYVIIFDAILWIILNIGLTQKQKKISPLT